jgi:hypothetical protein
MRVIDTVHEEGGSVSRVLRWLVHELGTGRAIVNTRAEELDLVRALAEADALAQRIEGIARVDGADVVAA